MFELEADTPSYEFLLEFAVDVLLASEEARLSLPSVKHADDFEPDQARGPQQLIFYVYALTVTLTEWSHLDAGVQGIFPSAAARRMDLYLALFRRRLPSDWRIRAWSM